MVVQSLHLSNSVYGFSQLLKAMAIQCLNENGYLVSSSCSYHLHTNEFIEIINSAAQKTSKQIQLIHFNEASLDHPKLPVMSETSYLKFAVFKISPL